MELLEEENSESIKPVMDTIDERFKRLKIKGESIDSIVTHISTSAEDIERIK